MKTLKRTLFIVAIVCITVACQAAQPVAAADRPAQPSAWDTPPQPIGGTTAPLYQVKYPETARKDGIEGKVLVSVFVSADGRSQKVKVAQSVREDLDKAAMKAVEDTHWTPAKKDGKPVGAEVIVPVMFKLEKHVK